MSPRRRTLAVESVRRTMTADALFLIVFGLLMLAAGYVFESRPAGITRHFGLCFLGGAVLFGFGWVRQVRRAAGRARRLPPGSKTLPPVRLEREVLFLPFWILIGVGAYSGRSLGVAAGVVTGLAAGLFAGGLEARRCEASLGATLWRNASFRRWRVEYFVADGQPRAEEPA